MLRSPPDDYRVPGFRGVLNDSFGNLQNAFAVHQVQLVRIEAAFIAPAQKGFEEPVVERIGAFLANFDHGLGAIRKSGDLLGQQLIPKLPAQLRRKHLSDFASAASVLPFDRDDFDHEFTVVQYSALHAHPKLVFPSFIASTIPLPHAHSRQDRSSSKQTPGRT